MSSPRSIAIIGAGFSGTLVASHLLLLAKSPLNIHLIERTPGQFGRGVAYSTFANCHLLNVPAGNMSAFPDDKEHFLRWAKHREGCLVNEPWVQSVSASSFLPRKAYGDYLADILVNAERNAAPGVRLFRYYDEAIELTPGKPHAALRLSRAGTLYPDKVILALGNFPPGDPPLGNSSFYSSHRYFGNPWSPNVMAGIWPTKACLLIGSGLTMVDWTITLQQSGYTGTIHCISRRGLWPHAHQASKPVQSPLRVGTSLLDSLRQLRRSTANSPESWRAHIDALRPNTQELWKSLPLSEKRRFLRHLRPYWDCHRHRLAPVVAEHLKEMSKSGRLVQHIGRIQEYVENEKAVNVQICQRGSLKSYDVPVEAVVNCSGSETNYRKLERPLIRDLLAHGLVRPDPLEIGLDVDEDGALIDSDGKPSRQIYTLGPPQKGILWETTAVPELRGQAARLAARLMA